MPVTLNPPWKPMADCPLRVPVTIWYADPTTTTSGSGMVHDDMLYSHGSDDKMIAWCYPADLHPLPSRAADIKADWDAHPVDVCRECGHAVLVHHSLLTLARYLHSIGWGICTAHADTLERIADRLDGGT